MSDHQHPLPGGRDQVDGDPFTILDDPPSQPCSSMPALVRVEQVAAVLVTLGTALASEDGSAQAPSTGLPWLLCCFRFPKPLVTGGHADHDDDHDGEMACTACGVASVGAAGRVFGLSHGCEGAGATGHTPARSAHTRGTETSPHRVYWPTFYLPGGSITLTPAGR
jgi:hypothetical protein